MLASRAERYGHGFSVVLFDVDRFKAYNDTAGHPAGDEVLRTVAGALAQQCRSGDTVYRYGGEELLAVLPAQDLEGAAIAAERMRQEVESLAIPHPGIGPPPGLVTVSGGVASYSPDDGGDVGQAPETSGRGALQGEERRAQPDRGGRTPQRPLDPAPAALASAQRAERLLEPLLDPDLRLPAQHLTRARGVEGDVAHLAGALRLEVGGEAVGGVGRERLHDVDHA